MIVSGIYWWTLKFWTIHRSIAIVSDFHLFFSTKYNKPDNHYLCSEDVRWSYVFLHKTKNIFSWCNDKLSFWKNEAICSKLVVQFSWLVQCVVSIEHRTKQCQKNTKMQLFFSSSTLNAWNRKTSHIILLEHEKKRNMCNHVWLL